MTRWYPVSINYLRNAFNFNNYPIISNISYTFQYITYLDKKLKEEDLSSVIRSLLIKDYIINSMSIIEALLFLLIKQSKVNIKKYSFNNLLITTKKYNLLDIDIININNLRKLRNKVHIYDVKKACNTDYNTFNIKEFTLMKNILKSIILNNKITNYKKRYFITKYFSS